MILKFARRYFSAKKSAHAINIISWVTASVIAFATCCQILVLSVFNGFENLVQSLYVTFYSDYKIIPERGKTFELTPQQINAIRSLPIIEGVAPMLEEKALLIHGDAQTVIDLKGVDSGFALISNITEKVTRGDYELGTEDHPELVMGAGIRQATGITIEAIYEYLPTTIVLPKSGVTSSDPVESISEGNIKPSGSFTIQQEFDNTIALTNIAFVRTYTAQPENVYTAIQLKVKKGTSFKTVTQQLSPILSENTRIQTRYEQNSSLFNTMRTEKWAIYAILTLILIIAAFNIISALSMLVLEKKRDIAVLKSLGATDQLIMKIFVAEGLLLGVIGTATGILLASVICFLQLKFKLIPMQGDSFLINYFPVKLVFTDFILVAVTALSITALASWIPAYRASRQSFKLQ
jgi:lipoprotein-releasing system permease protein